MWVGQDKNMAQTPITTGNHSFQNYNGWARYKNPATALWGSTPNTCVITDAKVSPNSYVLVKVTGVTPQAGRWTVVEGSGIVTITSSDAESATLPLEYIIL